MNRLIVLDTNIVVSAGLSAKSFPSYIVSKALQGDLVTALCPSIMREYSEVFSRPKFKRFGFPPIWLNVLIQQSHYLPKEPPEFASDGPDLDDLVFLNLAAYLGAILISGNIKHFPKNITKHIEVLTPSEYLSLLESS